MVLSRPTSGDLVIPGCRVTHRCFPNRRRQVCLQLFTWRTCHFRSNPKSERAGNTPIERSEWMSRVTTNCAVSQGEAKWWRKADCVQTSGRNVKDQDNIWKSHRWPEENRPPPNALRYMLLLDCSEASVFTSETRPSKYGKQY